MPVVLSTLKVVTDGDSTGYVRSMQDVVSVNQKAVDSDKQVVASLDQTERKLGTSATAVERFKQKTIEGYRENANYAKSLADLNRFMDQGKLTSAEYEKALAGIQVRYSAHTAGSKAAAEATQAVGTAAKLTYTDVEILRSGLINTVQSLAAGEGAARTLQTQLVQTAPALTGVARSLGLSTTAALALGAPLVAVAAGMGLVIARAISISADIRQFTVALDSMRTSSLASGADLEKMTRDLQSMGVAAGDAKTALTDVIRVQNINPAQAGRIVATGANAAAGFGGDVGSRSQQIATALSQGTEAVIKLGLEFKAFDAIEAQNLRTMDQHGHSIEAVNRGFGEIEQTLSGRLRQSQSEATRAFIDMKTAYDSFLDSLAKTGAIEHALGFATMFLDVSTKLLSGKPLYDAKGVSDYIGLDPRSSDAGIVAQAAIPPAARTATPGVNGLSPQFASSLQQMIADAAAQGINIGIVSGLRSTERQAQLYGADVAAHGGSASGLVAPPGRSLHEQGLAADLSRSPEALAFAHANASKYGLTFPMSYEPWHIEPAGARGGPANSVITGNGTPGTSDELNKLKTGYDLLNAASKQYADNLIYQRSYAEAFTSSALSGDARIYDAETKAEQAVKAHRIELQKTADTQTLSNQLTLDAAQAYAQDEVQGLRAAAQAQAVLAQRAGDALDVQSKATEILRTGAATAIDASAKTIPALALQTAASQRLADASAKGSAAEHEAELQNQATTATHDALAKAIASGDAGLVSRAQKLQDLTLAQIKANDAATQAKAINDSINQRTDQIAVIGVQRASLGQTPEAVQAATAALQEQFRLRDLGASVSDKQKADDLASVTALGQANIQLADAARNQQRWEDGIRSAADTVDNTLVSAIESAFDPTKVTSWAQTIKNALASITSGLLNSLLIKPAIGSLLGAFGQNNLATQYGSLSSVFGGGSTGGGGLLGGLFGTGSLFGSQGPIRGTAADLSIAAGGPPLALGAEGEGLFSAAGGLGGLGVAGGGILGTLGAAVPYVGLALAAGSLISGLFSNSKPKNQAAGGNIDLATGRVNGAFSGGNSQIDSATSQATSQIGQFIQQISGATGGSLSGSVLLQGGVNTGFTADSTLPGYTGQYNLGKDATQAVGTVELALAHSLQGVSATVQQIINTVTDPSQLATAVQFAKTYDDLKDAFDGAFQSISADTKKIGPFQDALNQINTTFDSLTQQAQQYGLSLDPVNQARTDSLARLNQDFTKNISDLMLAITDPVKLSIEQEREAGQQRVQDAIAIGASLEQVNRLNAASLENIWKQQTQSLQQLSDSLKSGALSGLTILDQLSAANDNFQKELGLVQGGNLAEIGNFATAGQNAVSLAQTAYGNGPQTAAIHNTVASAVDSVLSSRSFAGGTDYTPPGWVRVGEAGPEWMYQPGGATVLPNGSSPTGGNLGGKIDRLAALIDTGNRILQAVGSEQVTQLRGARSALERNPPVAYQKQRVA